ncbi:hypothetical protein TIFTF001_045813 [Ficus carica]|uniref:Uncharacterized protein n=1 Tax=Ficus carica TaxID=3494 RepID=A0AA87Z9I4_FICCA|nr:hypothetical protein TIFTF001_045813 [Ficus carica]
MAGGSGSGAGGWTKSPDGIRVTHFPPTISKNFGGQPPRPRRCRSLQDLRRDPWAAAEIAVAEKEVKKRERQGRPEEEREGRERPEREMKMAGEGDGNGKGR